MSDTPKKGSKEWVRNEKIINENPTLRAARDRSEGFTPRKGGSTHGGKGSAPRTDTNSQAWKDAYDQIDWSHVREEKKSYRVKINGKYVDES